MAMKPIGLPIASSAPDSAGPTAVANVCAPVSDASVRPTAPGGARAAASGVSTGNTWAVK